MNLLLLLCLPASLPIHPTKSLATQTDNETFTLTIQISTKNYQFSLLRQEETLKLQQAVQSSQLDHLNLHFWLLIKHIKQFSPGGSLKSDQVRLPIKNKIKIINQQLVRLTKTSD